MVGVGCDVMSWFCVWVLCFVFSNYLVKVVVIFFVFYCCNFSFEVYYKFLKIMNMLWIVYWYKFIWNVKKFKRLYILVKNF